ncbi:gluconokinase [Salimicrobium halophilum]|uniref:Gluconate kinase, FGGY family n=1 Tax=Salimicrobium halophilum TaxID=86666 RepID=A0A1G8RJQ2_9BACI|nr:gluconokinase [Salimicrobium halophilum]SDJ17171.1 gluconate kinase, FGGY family [Salimicrobium halophilum]
MQEGLVIGLDIGTTSAKAVLFETNGKVVKETEEKLETLHPFDGAAEQDPIDVEEKARLALTSLMENIDKSRILAGGFSAAMHSFLFVDGEERPLSHAALWSDARSLEDVEAFPMKETIYEKTGTPIHPMTPLVKLFHHKRAETEAYRKAKGVRSLKEYIIYSWFGDKVTDYSMASATGMYNIQESDWDEQALGIAGIDKGMLNPIAAPDTKLSLINTEIAGEVGLPEGVPFYLGACDGQLANLGDGAIAPGEVAISAGTSGAIRQFAKNPSIDKDRETFTYAFEKDSFIVGGPTNNGGIILQWIKEVMGFQGTTTELTALAEDVAPGADGVLFIPHVNGERSPVWDQGARGSFHNLSIQHKQPHFVRACLEGIAFNLYHIGQSVERMAGEPKRIRMNGGLSKSRLFVQILADVFGHDVELSETHHSAAWGAAWTALVGAGYAESYEAIREYSPVSEVINYDRDRHEVYQNVFKKYHRLVQRG